MSRPEGSSAADGRTKRAPALRTLDGVDAPDLWGEISTRPPGPPTRLPSPGRRAAIVVFSLALSLAVLAWTVIGLSGSRHRTSIGGKGPEERTASVLGVGVTYPAAWPLVDLWPLSTSIATWPEPVGSSIDLPDDTPERGGLPVLQLSDRDLGLASACSSASTEAPDTAVLDVALNGGPYRA